MTNPWRLFHQKNIEPVKRKHGKPYPEWQIHRFPIKNGISWRDAMLIDIAAQRNPWLPKFCKLGEAFTIKFPSRKKSRRFVPPQD